MQLNVRIFILMSALLVNYTNVLAQSSHTLYSKIDDGCTIFVRQGKFLASCAPGVELNQEDKVLIDKIIDLYQVSHNTLVDFTPPNGSLGQMGYHILFDGTEHPYISLSSYWQKLPYKHKEFILAHEMARFVLGYCKIIDGEHVANIYKTYGDTITHLAGFSFCGLFGIIFGAISSECDNSEKTPPSARALVYSLTGIFASVYALTATSLKHNQAREKEADIKAVIMLGDAQGGITWLTEKSNQENRILAAYNSFMIDTFYFSSHPSDYARIAYLQEWQNTQTNDKAS